MQMSMKMAGTRLEFVAVKLDGTLKRDVIVPTVKGKMTTFKRVAKEVPAGWIIYFPKGHAIRIKDREHLEHYNLNRKPKFINLQGLHDPQSPMGRMMSAQDEAGRSAAYHELEQFVMQLAIARSGPMIMPEQVAKARFIESEDYMPHNVPEKGKHA